MALTIIRHFGLKRATGILRNRLALFHHTLKLTNSGLSGSSSELEKMAEVKVEIKSIDMIKPPLSPTLNHHKKLQLSFIDQIAPSFHTPFLFFYQRPLTDIANSQTTTLLKKSLSETLVQFYLLAGRVEEKLSINCNDQGVAFYEANVSASLVQVIEGTNNCEELTRLLLFPPLNNKRILAAVQVNHFSCGGMAICVCISHKIADGATFSAFVNAWATKTRGFSKADNATEVVFDSASFFPWIDLNGIFDPDNIICKEKIVTRRLIFDKKKLDTLKKLCDDGTQAKPPSRGVAFSAFFWKLFIETARAKTTYPKLFCAAQPVNLRTIKLSPIPENWCGNVYWRAYAYAQVEAEVKYAELAHKLRTAVKQIDTSYLEKIKTGECLVKLQKHNENFDQGISNLIRFPLYEVNFGWGTPIWVSMTTLPSKNVVMLLSTKCGEGVEAWVNMLEYDMAALEQDHEFRSLQSHNWEAKEEILEGENQ